MIEFIETRDKKALIFDKRELFSETELSPVLSLGIPDMKIDGRKCPSFSFKDKTVFYPAKIAEVDKTEDGLFLRFVANELFVDMKIVEDEALCISLFSDKKLAVKLNLNSSATEHFFGAGEHFRKADMKGEKVRIFVEEHISAPPIAKKIVRMKLGLKSDKPHKYEKYTNYYVQPTFIASDPTKKTNLSFIADSKKIAFFDFRKKDLSSLYFYELPLSIEIKSHPSVLEAQSYFAKKTGILPYLPDNVFDGMILGIQSGSKVCDEKLEKMLAAGCKINGIWAQDWCGERVTKFGKQVYWNFTPDDKLYADYEKYIEKWKKQGVGFFGYVNPYLCEDGALFAEAKKKGYLVTKQDGSVYLLSMSTFLFGTVDLTNPDAYSWYKENIKKNMIGIGMAGWMADFGEYLPVDAVLYGGSGYDIHNIFPVLWAKCNREALEETGTLGKVVFFMRSGYLNAAKFNTLMWNGDQHVDFSRDYGLGSAIIGAISLAYSGMGTSHSDVGGYTTIAPLSRTKELYLRWLEMNAFMPFLRSHEGNRPWDSFQFDEHPDAIEGTAKFSNIYAKLKDYFKDAEKTYHETGRPVLTSVYSNFEEEKYVNIDDEIFVGKELLLCPVVEKGGTQRKVVLPCDMIHLFTKKKYLAGEHIVSAPLGTPAVFFSENGKFAEFFEKLV